MDAPESGRSRSKRDAEDRIETRESRAEDEEDWDGSDRKKHRSSKSRKHSAVEEVQDPESGKKKSSSERTDDRKMSGSLNRAGSGDEDDYDVRRESRSKIPRKSLEERGQVRPSEGYLDRGLEGSRKSRDEEHEWDSSKKTSTKPSGHDSSQGKTRSKADSSHEGEPEKGQDRDPKYSDKKESSREKGNPQHKRWDETEAGKRADESSSADRRASDYNKHGSTRERQLEPRIESGEARGRIVDLSGDKGVRSDNREEKRVDREGNRSRGRSEGQDDDSRAVTTPWEVRSDVNRDEKQAKIRERSEDVDPNAHRYSTKPYSEKAEKHRRDEVEGRERSVNIDEDGHGRLRDRSGREVRKAKRSRTPERSERYHRDMDEHDRGYSESETEKSMGMRGKEREKEGCRDDRSTKGKDASWSEKNREREGSKDHWRRSHTRPDGKDGDIEFDHAKEWDSQRRDQDRDSQRRDQDRDSQRRDQDRDSLRRNQDRDSQRRDQDRDSQRRDQDRDSQRRDQDRDSQRRDQDRDSLRRDQDRDLQRREQDRDSQRRDQDRDSQRRDQDRDSQRRDPDRDAQRRDQDRDSLRRDQDRDVQRREQDRDVQRRDQDRDSQRRDQDRDLQRRDQDRVSVYRKDTRIRSEGGKANFMDKSDSIEIRPNKNLDFGREESVASFLGRRAEAVSQQDFASGPTSDEEWGYPPEDRGKMAYGYGDDSQEKFQDDGLSMDQNSVRNSLDAQVGKGRGQKPATNPNRPGAGQGASSGMHPPLGNQGSGPLNRGSQQGQKGGRQGRGGRGRLNGRESQRIGLPLPMMGPPFGHLGLPPGTMQPIGPNIAHSPGPPIGPNVFIPPFPGPLVWPGARGMDMNMLAVPPNLPPIPPGPAGPRFAPNMGSAPNHAMYFNQPGPGRGVAPNVSGPGFNAMGPASREMQHDKPPIGWSQTRSSGSSGKAPSRGEQNDYSQNFVDTGMRPQNFIRELELTSTVEDYPKLRELIQRKDEIVAKAASPPMYYKCDLREHVLSPEFFGTKFDVILVDPPWEEYVHRAPGVTDHLEYWTFEEIQNLKIEAIADTPSFIFLWVGDGVGLEQGRQCLKKWGFRRCEDICWVKTNKKNATPGLRHDSHTLLQHSKEHCLMGIKGTVRRSTDGHIIHANIDTDIIIAEEPPDGSTKKPDDMYRIIEHFALGRRRLELFGEDHNIRSGWLTVGKGLSSSNFNPEAYIRNFADKDGKVWQGGGGRNPPPEAPHLVLTTPEIEGLRPKSPPAKSQQQQQQQQQQSMSVITTGGSSSRRPSGNSPQNNSASSFSGMNQDLSMSETGTAPWASSPMGGLRGLEGGGGSDDKFYDGYGFNATCAQVVGDHIEFDPHRTLNMM